MAILPPVLGSGLIFGDVLRGSRSYVGDVEISPPIGIEVQFFATSGEFIGLLGTTYGNAPYLEIGLDVQKIGGLVKFSIMTSRNIDIPFFNQMVTKVFVDGVHWYTGELTYLPDQDRRDIRWEISGRGYVSYLEQGIINELYTSTSLTNIVKDIIQNEVSSKTPIIYNPDLIVLPDFTPTKLELNKKSPREAMKKILQIANSEFNDTEYVYGVDKNRHFYFYAMESEVQAGFFEGFQFQNPDVETSDKGQVNKVDIFRTVEDSDTVEFVSTTDDAESISKYGEKYRKFTIPDYFDSTTAAKIAAAMISENKEPRTSIEIENLLVEDRPFEIAPYLINSKPDDYRIIVTDCEDLTAWTQSVSNTTVTEETTFVFTGKKSIKVVTASGSSGEYIEFELDESIQYPSTLSFYVWQNPAGEAFDILVYDDNGNVVEQVIADLTTESGEDIITESGEDIITEAANEGIDTDIVADFIKLTIDISSLDNIKKIVIVFATDSEYTLYFDRFDVFTNSWRQRELKMQSVKYELSRTSFLARAVFGDEFPSLVDDVKKISEKQTSIYGIFEKDTP